VAGDVLKQLLLRKQASELYEFQLDESTDVAGLAQLRRPVTFMGGQLRKTSSSANHWKPGQDIFLSTGQLCDIKWTLVVKMCWYLYGWRKSHDRVT
jgi:hypothetical protein